MPIPENKRVIAGVCILLIVIVVWVLSSELTSYIFTDQNYNKPFLTTYLKSSMFSFLLFGFLCRVHWRMLACPQKYMSSVSYDMQNEDNIAEHDELLSEPIYVPISHEFSDDENTLNTDDEYVLINPREVADNHVNNEESKRSVKFCKYTEVRHLSETYAEDSLVARMSYTASKTLRKKILIEKIKEQGFLPATDVMKLAAQFCFCWFIASYSYQKSLSTTLPAVVNVVSSTSSLFTLLLATFFPSSQRDSFSVTKLFVVFLSIGGVTMISFAESFEPSKFQYEGIIWGLVGALGYAVYLVNLRRQVKNEDQISLPMFLGFVGLWTVLTLWPGFFIFNWTNYEKFEVPNWTQLGYILLNGLLGTVGAELLWLWGCFLTSSLTATLSLCLTIPLTMVSDYFIKKKVYQWLFYLGSIPIIISFIAIAYLTNGSGPSPDPIGNICRRIFCGSSDGPKYEQLTTVDPDINSDCCPQTGSAALHSDDNHVTIKKSLSLPFAGLFSSPSSNNNNNNNNNSNYNVTADELSVIESDRSQLLINECREEHCE